MEQIPRSLRGRISGVERVIAVPGQDNKYKDRSWAGFVTYVGRARGRGRVM